MDNESGQAEDNGQIRLTFGELEARLGRLHEISRDKQSTFGARIRNFQRLEKRPIPAGLQRSQGKAVHYSPGQVFELALALELTQLGLLPERVSEVFRQNAFPIFMVARMAAQAILEKGGFLPDKERIDENMPTNIGHWWRTHDEEEDPLSMFLYFDPTALAALTDIPEKYEDQASATFFYGGAGIVKENIVRWTAGPVVRRLALINVTAVLWGLVVRSKQENQTKFLNQVVDWADALEEAHFLDTVQEAVDESEGGDVPVVRIETYEDIIEHAEMLRNLKGLPRPVADAMIKRAERIIEEGKLPDDNAGMTGKPWGEMNEQEVEEEIVGQLTLGGLPEMVARSTIEASRKDRHQRIAERQAREAERYYVDKTRIEAAGLSPFEVGQSGKVLRDMKPDEFQQELERREIDASDKKPKRRKAKKHGGHSKA